MLTLRSALQRDGGQGVLHGPAGTVSFAALGGLTGLPDALAHLQGKNVMLDVVEQATAAATMISLDGIAARMLICPPEVSRDDRDAIAAKAEVDAIVDDSYLAGLIDEPRLPGVCKQQETQWLLLTSGTTGTPKIVSHSLRALTGAMVGQPMAQPAPVWATFYDIRRYGGMQIFLRAVFGGGSLVLPAQGQPFASVVARYGACGVTHISGTPSHWRRLLMMPTDASFAPGYVRLSGEIADQGILDALRVRFSQAKIGHAYASTEAGVGFEVNDGFAGFPASYVDEPGAVELRVVEDTLRIRSIRTAGDYVGEEKMLHDGDGFVDTGDLVERRGDRYFFLGRRGGIINVGGQKVNPEEIEAVINRHAAVRMSLVKSRRNPIMGAIVAADIVLAESAVECDAALLRDEIGAVCREQLPAWKVPASIRFVPALDVTAAGKLARHA